MITKIQKWGNSLAIRIPKELANEIEIKEGSIVSFSLDGQSLSFKREMKPKYTLKELLKGFTKKNKHSEFDWGKPVGKEIW